MSPLRIIEFLLLLCLVVGFGYLTSLNGFFWSYTAGIVIPLIVIVLLLIEDPKQWRGLASRSTKVRRI
jgi:membrane protein YdbS with pleckstrin-like domain